MSAGALGALGGRTIRLLAAAVLVAMVLAMLPPVVGGPAGAAGGRRAGRSRRWSAGRPEPPALGWCR